MVRWSLILMLVSAVWFAGCLESNPQPSPIGGGEGGDDDSTGGQTAKRSPEVDEDLLLASAMDDDGTVVLVGMNGCAGDADYAEAVPAGEESDADGDVIEGGGFAIDDDGGFGGVVPTVGGTDEIIVTFHFGPEFDPPTVVIPVPIPILPDEDDGRTPWFANAESDYDPDQGAGAPPEEVWDGFAGEKGLGGVEVVLDGDVAVITGLAWTTTPLSIIAALNQETFVQASSDADTSGGFVLEIPAASEDVLLLYAVNPSDKEKATAPTAVVVP